MSQASTVVSYDAFVTAIDGGLTAAKEILGIAEKNPNTEESKAIIASVKQLTLSLQKAIEIQKKVEQ